MVTAVDFVLYCLGCGIVTVSSAAAIRLVLGARRSSPKEHVPTPKWEAVPDPSDGLTDRLQAFQGARFASPIVQRTLPDDAGPPLRRPPRVPMALRPVPRPQPAPAPPPRKRPDDNKVIPIPLKMKKEEPPKEGA